MLTIEALSSTDARLDEAQLLLDQYFPGAGHSAREEATRPWGHTWIASESGSPSIAAVLLTWLVADEIHVLAVAVHEAMRGRSYGRRLLDHAFESLKQRGARKVFLEVRHDNTSAIGLYRRLGFSILNRRKGYYSDGSDALEMILSWDDNGHVIPLADE